MLRDHRTVTTVVSSDLCMSCGICQPSCHVDAITIVNDKKSGMFIPIIDESICDFCEESKVGKCVIVCPGVEVNFTKLSQKFIEGTKHSPILGNYDKCYYSHAMDHDVRFTSSSGGVVTSLLIFALEQKLIEGVAVITMDSGLEPRGVIARTSEEVRAAAGSKYCPAHLGDALTEIANSEGRYAVVGLPCHLHGVRKLEKINPRLKSKILYHFGLYCANTNSFHGTEYFLKKNEINPEDVSQLRYRGMGWPGMFSLKMKNGEKKTIKRGTTEKDKKRRAVFSSAFHYDFQLPRCFTCNDLTAELADISFADPWNKKFIAKEKVGKSMLVVRNKIGDELLKLAAKMGAIALEEADSEEVARSQNVDFKNGAQSRLKALNFLGQATPHYIGKEQTTHFRYMWNLGFHIMSFIPKNRTTLKFLPLVQFSRRVLLKFGNLL